MLSPVCTQIYYIVWAYIFLLNHLCSIVLRELIASLAKMDAVFKFLDVLMIPAAARRIKNSQLQKAVRILA